MRNIRTGSSALLLALIAALSLASCASHNDQSTPLTGKGSEATEVTIVSSETPRQIRTDTYEPGNTPKTTDSAVTATVTSENTDPAPTTSITTDAPVTFADTTPAGTAQITESFNDGMPYEIGKAYKGVIYQSILKKTLYISGRMDSEYRYYFETTEDVGLSSDIYIEKMSRGYYLYFTVGNIKQYIDLAVNGNYVDGVISDNGNAVWTYDSESDTFFSAINNDVYYLGGFAGNRTVGPSRIFYISGDNVENIDASQFPLHLVDPSSIDPYKTDPPVTGRPTDTSVPVKTESPKPTGDYTLRDLTFTSKYSPSTYYNKVSGQYGRELQLTLRSIISVTTKRETYNDLRTDLAKTDAGSKAGTIRGFYTHTEMNAKWDGGSTWNREHVWPKSKGWFTTSGAGADLHHIRPEDSGKNSSRGNKSFGPEGLSGYYCPPDDAKGDVARVLFYMLVRYEETDSPQYSVTSVAYSMEMLLEWNDIDPVDSYEITRNNVTYSIQGNRNPFIDCPDFADMIWG